MHLAHVTMRGCHLACPMRMNRGSRCTALQRVQGIGVGVRRTGLGSACICFWLSRHEHTGGIRGRPSLVAKGHGPPAQSRGTVGAALGALALDCAAGPPQSTVFPGHGMPGARGQRKRGIRSRAPVSSMLPLAGSCCSLDAARRSSGFAAGNAAAAFRTSSVSSVFKEPPQHGACHRPLTHSPFLATPEGAGFPVAIR